MATRLVLKNPNPPTSDRIGIVGAGAAGISAAYFLKEHGYDHVVLFERNSRVGGKCDSVTVDSEIREMGAVFVTASYREVNQLARQVGVAFEPLGWGLNVPAIRSLAGDTRYISVYQALRMGVAGLDFITKRALRDELSAPGFSKMSPRLSAPFSTWIDEYSLLPNTLKTLFDYSFTPCGYGYLSTTPACYALKFYDSHLMAAILRPGGLMSVRGGYQGLFEKIASQMEVRLNSPVTRVRREGNQICVETREKNAEYFHHLIVACPPDQTRAILDCDGMEADFFSRVKTFVYDVFAVNTPDDFPTMGILPVNYSENRQRHPVCWYRHPGESRSTNFYILSNEDSKPEDVVSILYADGKSNSWRLGEIQDWRRWRYFPHFSIADLQNGIYDTADELQGRGRVYHTGEIFNFSTVEMVVRYSKFLVERFFNAG